MIAMCDAPMPGAVFLDLYGVLADSRVMVLRYRQRQAEILQRQFGGSLDAWLTVHDEGWTWYQGQGAKLDALPGNARDGDAWVAAVDDMEGRYVRFLFERAGLPPPADPTRFAHDLETEVVRGIDALYPDARPTLKALRAAGYTLHLSTNASRSNAESAVLASGVRDQFDTLCLLEVTKSKKDRPYYWRQAFHLAGIDPPEAIAVDDVAAFLAPAAALGSRCFQILRPDRAGQTRGPWPVLESLAELPEMLQGP